MSATRPESADRVVAAARLLCAPELSARAVAQLDAALDPLRRSLWPQMAWRASRLTSSGFPVEFAFSDDDDLLRMTMEPAGPECDAADKLNLALAILERSDSPLPQGHMVDGWRQAQMAAGMRWGCWLGLRQVGDGLGAKLYLEATDAFAPDRRTAPPTGGTLRMVGHEPRTERTEYYFSLPPLLPRQLELCLERCGVADPAPLFLRLEACLGMPVRSALKWTQFGFSRTIHGGQLVPGAALFFRCSPRCAGRVARRIGARMKSFAPEMVSLATDADGNTEIRAGVGGDSVLRAMQA